MMEHQQQGLDTYIVTGATGGLGFAIAKSLLRDERNHVVLAVRDRQKGEEAASHLEHLGRRCSVRLLDLTSIESVDAFIAGWSGRIAGLVNNAGVQIVDASRFTQDQHIEETFAVNHLAALRLTRGLLPFLHAGRVLFIGSGTHSPRNVTATLFGFRGAAFNSVSESAKGEGCRRGARKQGMDRYATSKFLNMVTTMELSRRVPVSQASIFCLDPGLMAGTGLARTAPPIMQFLWKHCLPWFAALLPDTSTVERSGDAAAWVLMSGELTGRTGIIFSYDRKPSRRVWPPVFEAEIGQRVLDESMALLKLPPKPAV